MTVKGLIVSVLVVVSLVLVVAPVGISIHSLDVLLTASIQISPVKNIARIVKPVDVMKSPRFVAPAGVITAIPK